MLPVPGPFDGAGDGVAGWLGAVALGGVAVLPGAAPAVVAAPVGVVVLPVPGPLGPALAVPVVVDAPTGAAPVTTPGVTTTGALVAFGSEFPDGSSVDGIVSTVMTGFATAVGVP